MCENDFDTGINLLRKEHDRFEKLIGFYPKLIDVIREYDRKFINKKVIGNIQSEFTKIFKGSSLIISYSLDSYTYGNHSLTIWEDGLGSKYHFVQILECEYDNVVIGRKLNFPRLEEILLYQKGVYETQLRCLREDISSGLERLKMYNQLIQRANKIAEEFSDKFIKVFRNRFEKVSL